MMNDCCNQLFPNEAVLQKSLDAISESLDRMFAPINNKKENATMKVTYNGFTGELTKLERRPSPVFSKQFIYDLSIYDSEKKVTHSFTGVKLEDMRFSGGTVSFSE